MGITLLIAMRHKCWRLETCLGVAQKYTLPSCVLHTKRQSNTYFENRPSESHTPPLQLGTWATGSSTHKQINCLDLTGSGAPSRLRSKQVTPSSLASTSRPTGYHREWPPSHTAHLAFSSFTFQDGWGEQVLRLRRRSPF